MKIIWLNLGYPFYYKLWRKIRFGCSGCFYLPRKGVVVRRWLKSMNNDVFLGCEVQCDDAQSLFATDDNYTDWQHSDHHAHGRIIISNKLVSKKSIEINNTISAYYEFADYCILPVHLHWARPDIRLSQVQMMARVAQTITKPVVMVGDFNIWMLLGKYFLFQKDKDAYQLLTQSNSEVTHSISRTTIIPFVKLDYVFVSREHVDSVSVRVINQPLRGLDHRPIEVILA